MSTLNVSLGGLKLEANLDLGVGEFVNLDILTNATTIQCKARVLAIEDFRNKVYARVRYDSIPDQEYKKLCNYLYTLYWGRFQKWVIGGILLLLAYIVYVFFHPYL